MPAASWQAFHPFYHFLAALTSGLDYDSALNRFTLSRLYLIYRIRCIEDSDRVSLLEALSHLQGNIDTLLASSRRGQKSIGQDTSLAAQKGFPIHTGPTSWVPVQAFP